MVRSAEIGRMWIALFFSIAQVCGGLCNSEAFTHYARLLDRAQLGHAHSEKAAFLVLETDGRLREVIRTTGAGDGCTCCHSQIRELLAVHVEVRERIRV